MKVIELYWYKEDHIHLAWLGEKLSEVYGATVELSGEVVLPRTFYDVVRGQWFSNQVLGYALVLKSKSDADVLLLVVGGDAYVPGLNFVFGQALLGEGVAVVYTARLYPEFYGLKSDSRLFHSRLLKEAMHEIGHALGLDHCNHSRCVMRFSNSIYEVDAKEPRYCSRCVLKLEAQGVKVSEQYTITTR